MPTPTNKPRATKAQPASAPVHTHPALASYVGFFAIGYVLASALFMLVQTQLALSPQLVTVLSIVIGAYIAVYKFIKHHKRALSRREINRVSIGGVITVWLLTASYFLGLWLWVLDSISRELLIETATYQPWPLLGALVMMLLLSGISARVAVWAINRLLAPK